jgi:hypothetical protein
MKKLSACILKENLPGRIMHLGEFDTGQLGSLLTGQEARVVGSIPAKNARANKKNLSKDYSLPLLASMPSAGKRSSRE